jgi:Tol biopolymer transport system component
MISELCTHDLATGATRLVLRHQGERIEAPNWLAEGALLVNAGGRLFRVPLGAPRLIAVDTGPLCALNNDHGPSPDGRLLALCDKGCGPSALHLLPLAGGAPRRLPLPVPSWFHAWSPCGTRLAYACVRADGGPVHMRTAAADGSDERLVTAAFDHADGPDLTPDGGWIWFNGERDGAMRLWRIRPDGSGLERMTEGPTEGWFPHPSPCGAWVLYLAYPPGTRGHPADRPVALSLMPARGGPGRELLRLRGGQGSLNVPPWRPGGGAFAFVRYPA